MVRLPALFAAVVLLLAAPSSHAGAPPAPARGGTSILGSAWTEDTRPIPKARLRLRNVATGKIEAVTLANDAGEFTFPNVEGGSYVVELVNEAAAVQAVSHVFSIAPGETVATFVRLGTKRPRIGGFFENAAAAVVTGAALFQNASTAVTAAAAGLGITAVTPTSRPASAGR